MGGKIDHSIVNSIGSYSFWISGENYHLIGSLLPPLGELSRFIQLYIHDIDNELQNRMNLLNNHDGNLLKSMTDDLQYQIRRDMGNSQIRIDDGEL